MDPKLNHTKILNFVKQRSPLARIEKICEENHGNVTLASFARGETGKSKVKPYQKIKLDKITQKPSPLAKIEKFCEENYGHGTLACCAKSEIGKQFAITGQHVLQKSSIEKGGKDIFFLKCQVRQGKHLKIPSCFPHVLLVCSM